MDEDKGCLLVAVGIYIVCAVAGLAWLSFLGWLGYMLVQWLTHQH